MSKTLLIGPAGSGKTAQLLDDFESALKGSQNLLEDSFYFVLPSVEHTERIITQILQREIKGFFKRRVTTLSSLIHQNFAIPDENIATNVTRYLTLRTVCEKQETEYFQAVKHTNGFINLMLSFITELKESRISSECFRQRMNDLKQLEPDLSVKYESLAQIYEAYENALHAQGLRDRQDAFDIYQKRKIERSTHPVRFQKIWMDGFFDFSELQFAYLQELTELTDEMIVTLTLDPDEERRDLFETVHGTRENLEKMGFETVSLKPRNDNKTLFHIERHLFSQKLPKKRPLGDKSIAVFEAVGIEGEIEMVARTILRMSQKGDKRFSDFAILLRTIGEYESVIRSVFSRYGIPVEVHERERLGFSPLMDVLVKMLKIFQTGWKRSELMEFLKSTYVRRLGEQEKDYDWVNGLEHESMRKRVYRDREKWIELDEKLTVLADLEDTLKASKSCREINLALKQAVKGTFELFRPEGFVTDYIRRDAASLKRLESILDEIERSIPQTADDAGLFDIFCERFLRLAEIDLYSIRQKEKNRVQVYDISLGRQKEYKVVFVAGLLEKKFPVQIREDAVFSDWERRLFNAERTEERLKERLARQALERYLFYLAVTRAKEKLILSSPRLDLEGKESLPSYYIDEVKRLFDGPVTLRKQNLSCPYPELEDAVNSRELELAWMGALWSPERSGAAQEPLLIYLAHELLRREASREKIKRSFYQVKDELTDPAIGNLDPFRASYTSPSKLEAYGKCPFHYYARYVLQLNDPEEDPNVTMRGKILHKVLEECFEAWKEEPEVLEDRERAKKTAGRILHEVLETHQILTERLYQYDLEIAQLEDALSLFLDVELERLESAKLRPAHFEFKFGLKDAKAAALELEFQRRTVKICGIIDRVDVDASGKLAGVMDYKRKASFSRDALEMGTALQLPIYSLVAEKFLNHEVIAAELYSILDRKKNGFYREEFTDSIDKKKTKWTLFLDRAKHREVMEKSIGFIESFTEGMLRLKMEARPRDQVHCESYCPYTAVCRIQKWRLPFLKEEIKKQDAHKSAKVSV